MNAREHFDWSITRATEYLAMGDAPAAMASLTSDLGKHEGTAGILTMDLQLLLIGEYSIGGVLGVRRFIAGIPAPAGDQS